MNPTDTLLVRLASQPAPAILTGNHTVHVWRGEERIVLPACDLQAGDFIIGASGDHHRVLSIHRDAREEEEA